MSLAFPSEALHFALVHTWSAWHSGIGGTRQLGCVCVFERKATANAGVVPLCHLHVLLPKMEAKALRLPVTFNLCFRAIPLHTSIDFRMHTVLLGKSDLQVIVFFLPHLRWHVFSGTQPCLVRLCM